jgi:uncharacterized membrane protein
MTAARPRAAERIASLEAPPSTGPPQLSPHRLAFLSDGVFAIAMTLLVLGIEVPSSGIVGASDVPRLLYDLWPKFLSYVVSFIVLGVYWEGHHGQFHFIQRADPILIWLNMLFLMLIAAVPFSAALLARYGIQRTVVLFYGAHLVAVGAAQLVMWIYATRAGRLVRADLAPEAVRWETWRVLTTPSIYLIAMLLSLVSTILSIVLFVTAPLLYIAPSLVRGVRGWARAGTVER